MFKFSRIFWLLVPIALFAALGGITAQTLYAAPPVISNATADSTGSSCTGTNDGDGFCGFSQAVQVNDGATFASRFAMNVNADRGAGGTKTMNGSMSHNLVFDVTATGNYVVVVRTRLKGSMDVIKDQGTPATANISGVTGTSSATVSAGSLNIADPGGIANATAHTLLPFTTTNTALINAVGTGAAQNYALAFSWSAVATSATNEAGVRLGEQNGSTSGCSPCGYVGNPSRVQLNDGHFVTVTVTTPPSILGSSVPRNEAASASNSQIATVNDDDQTVGALSVQVNNGASATVNDVTVSNLAVDTAGNVTADVNGSCPGTTSFSLTVTDEKGAYATDTLNVNVAPTATTRTWTGATSTDWNTGSNWICGFAPLATHSAILPDSAVTHEATISAGDVSLTNLTIGANRSLTFINNRALTVSGVLTMNGGNITVNDGSIVNLGANASIARSSGYIIGRVKKDWSATGSFNFPVGTVNGYSPFTANVTALATNPSALTVRANQGTAAASPALVSATTLHRYWTLTETGDLTADLTFNYLDVDVNGAEADYRITRIVGGGQGTTFVNGAPCPGAGSPCVDAAANTLYYSGASTFSDWTAGFGSPTSATLIDFSAKATKNGNVKIAWETGSEMNLVGFNVWRKQGKQGDKGNKGEWKQVNSELIAAENPGEIGGAKYSYTDKEVKSGKTYQYKIQVVRVDGTSEWSEVEQVKIK